MNNISEGIKRIVLVTSWVAASGWVVFILLVNNWSSDQRQEAIIFILVTTIIVFFIPRVIAKIIYWIKEGFSNDGGN